MLHSDLHWYVALTNRTIGRILEIFQNAGFLSIRGALVIKLLPLFSLSWVKSLKEHFFKIILHLNHLAFFLSGVVKIVKLLKNNQVFVKIGINVSVISKTETVAFLGTHVLLYRMTIIKTLQFLLIRIMNFAGPLFSLLHSMHYLLVHIHFMTIIK
jgi:hypothetical protein